MQYAKPVGLFIACAAPDELAEKLMAINTVALPAIMAGEYAFQWALKRPT